MKFSIGLLLVCAQAFSFSCGGTEAKAHRTMPVGAHEPENGPDGLYKDCEVLHEGYCYTSSKDACVAAGCPDDCLILRSYPGQVECQGEADGARS